MTNSKQVRLFHMDPTPSVVLLPCFVDALRIGLVTWPYNALSPNHRHSSSFFLVVGYFFTLLPYSLLDCTSVDLLLWYPPFRFFFPVPFYTSSCTIQGMYNLKEIKKTCDVFIGAYHSYNDFMFDWVESKATIRKTVHAIFSKAQKSELPDWYWTGQASLYTDAHMLMDPKTIKKMRKSVEGLASEDETKALSFWANNPGFWCFYTLRETLGDDFFIIEDLLTADTHLMHAPSIASMQTDSIARNRHYLSLLLPNGSCLQVIGLSKYTSLTASDMQFYLSLFAPSLELGPAINKHFMRLIELDTTNSWPLFFEEGVEMKLTWQPFKLKDFSILDLEGTWDSKELGKLQIFSFMFEVTSYKSLPNSHILGPEPGSLKVTLVRDNTSGEMGLFTSTDTSYLLFSSLLTRSYPELALPDKPSVSISLGLSRLISEGNYPLPWERFRAIIDAMDAYTNANIARGKMKPEHEQGFQERLSSTRSVDRQNVLAGMDSSHEEIIAVYTVEAEDTIFEMFDWPQPPKQLQDLFDSPLNDSPVFEVMDDSNSRALFNTLTNGSYAPLIEQFGLASFVTSLFDEKFPEEISMFLMNSFIWILFHKGKSWVPARSYAIEILKMQPYPLTDIYFEREAFLQDFTTFIKKVLCTRGICSLAKRPSSEETKAGTYTIRGTDAFYSLIRPGEYQIY